MQTPNYLELSSSNMEATKAFYTKAFGFEFTDYGPEYAGANNDAMEIGLMHSETHNPPLPGFQTPDIAAAERDIVAAGGVIFKETYEFPGGKRFHFRDPGGNEMLAYQYVEQG